MLPKTRQLILLGIIIFAVFSRFFLLHSVPPGLYPDEAVDGLDGLRALEHADFKVFYTPNNGEEGLYMDIQALAIQIFGVSAWTLRAVSAAAGVLTVLFLYFLSREIGFVLFGLPGQGLPGQGLPGQGLPGQGLPGQGLPGPGQENRKNTDLLALSSSFLLAVSFWHINFSRIGFRAILLPLISTAALFYLLRALRKRSGGDFIVSGALVALSFYTYIAARVFPVLFLAVFICDFVRKRQERKFFRHWLYALAAFVLVITPLAGYFMAHPQDFFGRASEVSILSASNPLSALGVSIAKTLGMFNLSGDQNWRHNVSGSPMLDFLTGIFFLVGIGVSAFWLFTKRGVKRTVSLFLLLWFGIFLLPEVATAEGIPHALRALGAVPAIMVISVLGFLLIYEKIPRKAAGVFLAASLIFITSFNLYHYFYTWAKNPNIQGAFRTDLSEEAKFLATNSDKSRYVLVNESGVLLDGAPVQSATLRFLTGDDPTVRYLTEDKLDEILVQSGKTIIITTFAPSEKLSKNIEALFPDAVYENQNGVNLYKL